MAGRALRRCDASVASRRGPALADWVAFLRGRAVVVLVMSGAKRRIPVVVVRKPRTASLSAEDRRQSVTALAVMIHQWWSGGRAAVPERFTARIRPAALRLMAISELVRVGVGVRPSG